MTAEGGDLPGIAAEEIPGVTVDQMREIDRAMVQDLYIQLIQMMENAGRNLAALALRVFESATATVLAGGGGNGGGGLAAAGHLANRGVVVSATLGRGEHELAPATRHQLDILSRMGVPVTSDPSEADLVVDATGRKAPGLESRPSVGRPRR